MSYTEELIELNITELKSAEYGYKYVITTYEDITRIEYFEKNEDNKLELKDRYDLPSCHDIQICEKIIELRKAFKD